MSCVNEDEGQPNNKPHAVKEIGSDGGYNYIYSVWKLFRSDAFVAVFLTACLKCHNRSGLTFLLVLVVIYTANVGVKTGVDSGKGWQINTRIMMDSVNVLCVLSASQVCILVWAWIFRHVFFLNQWRRKKNRDWEGLVSKYKMKVVPLALVDFASFYNANGHIRFKSGQRWVLGLHLRSVSPG